MNADISSSHDRFTFQVHSYLNSCKERNVDPKEDILAIYDSLRESHKTRFDKPECCANNLEYDLLTTNWILEKTRSNNTYAQNLYAAMCNNSFQKSSHAEPWSVSWRHAGGIIADMQQKGDYIDWYCSGIFDSADNTENFVHESYVTDEVKQDLLALGWSVVNDSASDTGTPAA